MRTLVLRATLTALSTALLLCAAHVVPARDQPEPAKAEDQRMLPYIEPGQLVDIGGRRINLHCAGSGTPTVVLMAGISSWSPVWYKTQPVIAQKTRVCAFDRASYGFSDPAPRPQVLSDTGPQFFTTAYAVAKVSLISTLYIHRYDSVDQLHLGAMPLVVLSAEYSFDINTPAGVRFWQAYKKEWYARHDALAHLSSRGVHRIIKGSGHAIQLDKPQAVIDAVEEVLRDLKNE